MTIFLRLDFYSYVCLKVANNAPEKRWEDEDISKIGTMIKVKLGWEDELVDIFEGQVFGVAPHYVQTGETVDIYAMCGIARLAHGRKVRGFKEKKDSEIVQEIIKENGLTVGEMDSFGYKHKFTLQREVTDLEYILDIAQKTNTHFWCEGKKFFMKKDPDRGDEDIILEVDKTLFDFKARAETMKLITSVEMTGVNVRSFEKFVGNAAHGDLKKIGGDQLGCTVVDTEFGERKEQVFTYEGIDKNTVDQMAKDYLQGASMKFIKAHIGCQGDPRIVQGILLTLKEHSTRFDGKYFVRQVKHIIDPFGGFVTEFEGFKNAFGKEKGSGDGSGAAQAMVAHSRPPGLIFLTRMLRRH